MAKDKEERANDFMNLLAQYLETYSKETLRAFYDYWTESNPNGKKMRFEMQKVFDVKRRLSTWKSRENKFYAVAKKQTNLDVLSVAYHDNSLKEKYLKEEQENDCN